MEDKSQAHEMEKYREIYNLSKDTLDKELRRYQGLDDKASRYFTALTVLLGIYGLFAVRLSPLIWPPKSLFEWALVIILFSILLFIILSWFFLLKVLRIGVLATTPFDIEFFRKLRLVDFYYTTSRTNNEALHKNSQKNFQKSKSLHRAYITMKFTMISIVVFFISFSFYACNKDSKCYNLPCNRRKNIMPEDSTQNPEPQDTAKPSDTEPDMTIQPLPPDIVTHGATPSLEKRSDGSTDSTESSKDKDP